jgi:uncharacterized membrane protein YhaH (DUF805 family)
MFNFINEVNINNLHKMIVILLILFVVSYLIKRKSDNKIMSEVLKLIFLFFLLFLLRMGIDIFGKQVITV